MHVFTFQQIADAVPAFLERDDADADSWEIEPDIWDSHLDRVEDYFGNTAPGMDRELASRGFIIDHDAKTITVRDADTMTAACRLIREITWEYDCTKESADVPTHWWSFLPLGGDDDVDYNGSYLDIGIEPLLTLLPDEYQPRIEPDAPVYEDYHLPADVIEARIKAYREERS